MDLFNASIKDRSSGYRALSRFNQWHGGRPLGLSLFKARYHDMIKSLCAWMRGRGEGILHEHITLFCDVRTADLDAEETFDPA